MPSNKTIQKEIKQLESIRNLLQSIVVENGVKLFMGEGEHLGIPQVLRLQLFNPFKVNIKCIRGDFDVYMADRLPECATDDVSIFHCEFFHTISIESSKDFFHSVQNFLAPGDSGSTDIELDDGIGNLKNIKSGQELLSNVRITEVQSFDEKESWTFTHRNMERLETLKDLITRPSD